MVERILYSINVSIFVENLFKFWLCRSRVLFYGFGEESKIRFLYISPSLSKKYSTKGKMPNIR